MTIIIMYRVINYGHKVHNTTEYYGMAWSVVERLTTNTKV